ncbi:MAG: transcription antitermination factor NusB [Flavobacteriales bacterium]|nr:transcription antitermination factor NusB [Flavobacteriales bacterium]
MINRRHIRLKVMQSLYSYFSSFNKDMAVTEKEMMKNINSISELHVLLLSLLVEINSFTDQFLEDNKTKYIPSAEDLNPNTKFVNNRVIEILQEDEIFMKKMKRLSGIWRKGDIDIVRKLFVDIYKSPQYSDYLNNEKDSFSDDKKFIQVLYTEFILDNDILHHVLQERSIFWDDDLPFVASFIKNQINFLDENKIRPFVVDVFKNSDDKKFAVQLFRKTIIHSDEFDELIQKNVKNWELERIANMDQLLIKMALVEVISFQEMPIKVSFNEYIEISKYYSTEKSKVFINGILDKIVSQFKRDGKVKKVGRGLV